MNSPKPTTAPKTYSVRPAFHVDGHAQGAASFKMNKKTLKALQDSIAHWKRLASGNLKSPDEAPFGSQCALCALFWGELNTRCAACPVRQKVGIPRCEGTPFIDASAAWNYHGPKSPEFIRHANEEVAFLKSLLPQ